MTTPDGLPVESLGARLRELRAGLGITQQAMAGALRVGMSSRLGVTDPIEQGSLLAGEMPASVPASVVADPPRPVTAACRMSEPGGGVGSDFEPSLTVEEGSETAAVQQGRRPSGRALTDAELDMLGAGQ